uniref:Dynein axonemal intermediate chain 7 n=1 Tax=Leptobrachium leishanense TaxID=445787 RepID=A0A8C5MCP3_9ANUR
MRVECTSTPDVSHTGRSSKATSAASRRKGKPGKAEKLRLQREEEERRQQEEEEARLLAERLEAEQWEKECLEKEERERLEAKQIEHREEEIQERGALLEEKLEEAKRWKRELRIKAKWDRYMRCDGSPDPTIPQEINTYMSLWNDEKNEDFQSVLNKSDLVMGLIQELDSLMQNAPPEALPVMQNAPPEALPVMQNAPPEALPEEDAVRYRQTIRELQDLLYRKFNDATEHLLKNATALSDIDTGNMQRVIKNQKVTLCIWVNLNKNPRFKGYHFEDEAIGFDLPKPLAVSSIAVRILRTAYDHLSCQSYTFQPRVKESDEAAAPAASEVVESVAEEPAQEAEEYKPSESVTAPEEETKSEGRKSVLSSLSTREEQKPASETEEKPGQESEVAADSRVEEAAEALPPAPASLLNEERAEDLLEEDVVDLRQYTTLGGVYYFDAIALPPQCKQVNGWTMVQLLEGGLQIFPYPGNAFLLNLTSNTATSLDVDTAVPPPVGVTFRVPNDVMFFEEPQVARWDPEDKTWRTDSITQSTYNPELRQLSFKMDAFHTFTLIQDSHLNMPYESWELRPCGSNHVALAISSTFTEILLEIKDDRCKLASLSSTDCDLALLLEQWMSPLALKAVMRRAGLNIFPEEDSARYVIVNKKSEAAEDTAYKEMALLCDSFAFGWSKWNHSCGAEQIIIKVKEWSQPPDTSEESWALYMLNPHRTQRLKISESSEAFSAELFERSEFHSTLYHMIKDYASPDAMEAPKNTHHLFLDCVHQILSMTRVLTYS